MNLDRPAPPICPETGKVSFRRPEDAEQRRKNLKRKRNEKGLTHYRCAHCRYWHLGHGHRDGAQL